MINRNLYIFITILFSVFSYGQVSILSETNTKEYEVKEPFKLNIGLEISGNNLEQQTPVKLPDLSKFEILGNASEVFSFIDPDTGVLVKQMIYQLVLEPKQSGKIKIGSALVQVNGKIYKTEAFDIIVKENSKKESEKILAKNVQLSMETKNSSAYAFEPISITLKASGKNFHNFRKIHHIQLPRNKVKVYPISLNQNEIEIGNTASQVIASFIVYPDKTGIYSIPAALAKLENEQLTSNTLNINIKPLPQGAPSHFKNAVGEFGLEIIKLNDQAFANETFEILIKLSGQGNFDHIELPKILESTDYQILNKPKKSTNITTTSKGLVGEITEHYIIIPKKEGNMILNIEDFSFFNPKNNKYQNISKTENILVSNTPQDSTIEKLMDDTGHILKKVELSPISQKEEKEKPYKGIIGGFSILGILGGILIFFLRKRKRKAIKTPEKITTIAETEEILKYKLFIGKEYYFRSLKKDLENNMPLSFFEHYDELHYDAEEQVRLESNKNIEEFLENTTSIGFVQEFKEFREKIQIEKYAPIHQDLNEYYNNIIKFYSKIMK